MKPHAHPEVAPQLGELKKIGRYPLLRKLARGGMSEVFLAVDPQKGTPVAIKLLTPELASDPSFVNRFVYEGRMSRNLEHRNLVRGLDAGVDPATGRPFLVLEFIPGPSAQQRLEQIGRFSIEEALHLVLEIAHALEFLHHRQFVHRDIKPGNILLAPGGGAKLADLGVAKHLEGVTDLTSFDQGIGTPYYMPWEQTLNASLVEPRSDLFALGATFYHLITGAVPFPGETEGEIEELKRVGHFLPASVLNPLVPPVIDAILARLLAKDHTRRFGSARELIEVLTASGVRNLELDPLPTPQAPTPSDRKDPDDAPTRPDLAQAVQAPVEEGAVWILCYRLKNNTLKRVRGRTSQVLHWLQEGLLPQHTYAARQGQRRFRRLRDYAEFRDCPTLAPLATEPPPSRGDRLKASGRPATLPNSWLARWSVGLVAAASMLLTLGILYILIARP